MTDARARRVPNPTVERVPFIGSSPAMQAVREAAERVAPFSIPLLLSGETGSGKEVVARYIHFRSPRRGGPFLALNCANVPDTTLEAELFGYEPGAFTGADARGKPGLLVLAHGGTLLLDELGAMPATQQKKVLRAVETGVIWPLGAVAPAAIDVRIIAATNAPDGVFPDLLYRLRGYTIEVPALRDHAEDVAELVAHFAAPAKVAPAAISLLARHAWPGNVRELRWAVEALLIDAEAMGSDGRPTKGGTVAEWHVRGWAERQRIDLRGADGASAVRTERPQGADGASAPIRAALRLAAEGVSLRAIERRLGWASGRARHYLSARRSLSLADAERLADALGLVIDVRQKETP